MTQTMSISPVFYEEKNKHLIVVQPNLSRAKVQHESLCHTHSSCNKTKQFNTYTIIKLNKVVLAD